MSEGAMAFEGDSDACLLSFPEAKWSFTLEESGSLVFSVPSAPSAFHRFMQRWVLGIRWKRIEE